MNPIRKAEAIWSEYDALVQMSPADDAEAERLIVMRNMLLREYLTLMGYSRLAAELHKSLEKLNR